MIHILVGYQRGRSVDSRASTQSGAVLKNLTKAHDSSAQLRYIKSSDFQAAKLSTAFVDTDKRTPIEVNEAIKVALGSDGRASGTDAVATAFDRLYDLGYILPVRVESRRYFRPGYPA